MPGERTWFMPRNTPSLGSSDSSLCWCQGVETFRTSSRLVERMEGRDAWGGPKGYSMAFGCDACVRVVTNRGSTIKMVRRNPLHLVLVRDPQPGGNGCLINVVWAHFYQTAGGAGDLHRGRRLPQPRFWLTQASLLPGVRLQALQEPTRYQAHGSLGKLVVNDENPHVRESKRSPAACKMKLAVSSTLQTASKPFTVDAICQKTIHRVSGRNCMILDLPGSLCTVLAPYW